MQKLAALLIVAPSLSVLAAPTPSDPAAPVELRPARVAAMMAASDDDKPIRVRRSADGLFRIDANRDGKSIRLIVDTGATATVLTRADARQLGIDPDSGEEAVLATAGGHSAMRWATLTRLRIGGHRLQPIYVAVADNNLPHSLLGQEALAQLGRITLDQGKLEIAPPVTG